MYLVTGATGNVGGPVARQLQEQGHRVRALVRDPARAAGLSEDIELAVGDLGDPGSVREAVHGVDAVFLVQVGHGTGPARTMVEAARAAGSPRIVLLSSVGALTTPAQENPIGAALAAREQVLRESGLGVTFLRPNTFASNSLWWADAVRAGHVVGATGEGRTGVIDPEDIARVAVAALTDARHAGQGYSLTGPQALTAREQVEIIAGVIGRPVHYEDVTPQEYARRAIERGTEPEVAHMMEKLHQGLRAGGAGFVTDDVENITGRAPGTFRAWCERTAAAFR